MTNVSSSPAAASAGAIGEYLRTVADALAAPKATAEAVLEAARARDVRRWLDDATFTPPDPRLRSGRLMLTGVAGSGTAPSSIVFVVADADAPVRLAEVAEVFGAWADGIPGPGSADAWPVDFTDDYVSHTWSGRGGAAIFIRLNLSGSAAAADTRVRRVLLRREA